MPFSISRRAGARNNPRPIRRPIAMLLFLTVLPFLAAGPAAADQWATCRDKLQVANAAGLIVGVDLDGIPRFVLNAEIWNGMPFESKEGLARVAECWLMTGHPGAELLEFIDSRTHQRLGSFNGAALRLD
jgi:hypothetical protein